MSEKLKKLFSRKHQQPEPVPEHGDHDVYEESGDSQAQFVDCPLTPIPLEEFRTLISSPKRSRPRRWTLSKKTLKTLEEKQTGTESSETNTDGARKEMPLHSFKGTFKRQTRVPIDSSSVFRSEHADDNMSESFEDQTDNLSTCALSGESPTYSQVSLLSPVPFPMNPSGQPPFPSHPPLEQRTSIPDEILLTVVSSLMHRRNCRIPNCPCKSVQERYRELYRQHPSYHPHHHTAESRNRECGPNTDPGERKHENLATVPGSSVVPGNKLPDIVQLFQEAMKRAHVMLQEAMKRGHVMCRTLNYAVTGAAGTGKSHTVSLILNEDPPKERHSTGLLNSPIRAISSSLAVSSNLGSEFPTLRRAKEGDILDILAISAKQGISTQDSTVPDEQLVTSNLQDSAIQDSTVPDEQLVNTSAVQDSAALDEQQASTPAMDGEDYRNLQAVQELFARLVGGMMEAEVSDKQFDFVHLLDSGGQPQFHQLLPTFVPHLDANIFVLKLCEMLDQHPKVEFYQKGELVTSYQSFHTNQRILKHCIRAIQSQSSPDRDSTTRVAVVGTHKDQQDKCSERLKEKNKKLIALLKSKFSSDNLIYYQSLKEMIFPVNAKTPDKEDREVAQQLVKSLIENSSSKAKPIPLPWFLLEQMLRKVAEDKGTGVLHISECKKIANKLGIPREALGAALGYLVGLNLFLYYPLVLPKVFFTEPQVLLDKINELVHCSHLLRGDPNLLPDEMKIKLKGLCGKQWERFGYYGILTEELLKHKVFSSYYVYDDELFTPANLLELLQALLIISPINRTEFIMPCLLPELDAEELDKHRSEVASSIAPLLIHFPNEWPQSGVFCSLMASLLSYSEWEVLQGGNSEPMCLHQNCIDFQLPGPGVPGTVTLIDSFDSGYFEVHVDDNCKPLCPQIRQTIFTTLERIPNAPKPVIAFFCPQKGKQCKAFCHRACFICSCRHWKCSENPRVNGELTKHQLAWIESSSTPTATKTLEKKSQRATPHLAIPQERGQIGGATQEPTKQKASRKRIEPTLPELLKFTCTDGRAVSIPVEVATKYVQFGTFLLDDRNGSRVKIMAHMHHYDAEHINIVILHQWLTGRGRKPVTWETLVEVLHDIELCTLASDIMTTKCLTRSETLH